MGIDFYLDLMCTFLLQVFEHVFCCGNQIANNPDLDEKKKKKLYATWKRRILLIRVIFGFIFNICGFITVCVMNKETFIEETYALGLFITIIVFTLTSYILIELAVWFGEFLFDDLICMIFYRVHEIEFDVLVFFYSLVLSDWKMTEFTIATTVLASSDILINIIILIRNCYDLQSIYK